MQESTTRMWGIGKRETWSQILVVPVPVWRLPVCLPRKIHRHNWPRGVALQHSLAATIKPVIEAWAGRHLVAMDFIRRLQQRIAQPARKHQIGGDAPRILGVHL